MIVMIDNFDSFTYNLVQAFEAIGEEVSVYRNDAVTIDAIDAMAPRGIIVSPGPGTPESAGISTEVVRRFCRKTPIFGVCLGHQCIAAAFGADVVHAGKVMHGKFSPISHDGDGVFAGVPQGFYAVRYHSLAVKRSSLPDELRVSAEAEDGEIMGLTHRQYPLFGVQFHPESIATECGLEIMRNFVAKTKEVV